MTADDGAVLSDLPLEDDDPLWKAIVHQYAYEYWSNRLSEAEQKADVEQMKICNMAMDRHERRALHFRHIFSEEWTKRNQDQAFQTSLPADYFTQSDAFITLDHGRIVRRR